MNQDTDKQNFYKRMNEIGEYTYQNRMDTIFVFQLIFISLLIVIGLLYLKSINIVTPFFVYPMIVILTIVVIFILVNRIVLTDKVRSKNNWYQLNFGDGTIAPSDYVTAGTAKGTVGLVNIQAPSNGCPAGQHQAEKCVPN
jgi:uncharacterized membrane protein